MQPRLTRSRTDTMIAGVCGGLAEYFSIDPIIVRLIFVVVTLTSGFGPPVYILLWILMPRQPRTATPPQPTAPYPPHSGQPEQPAQPAPSLNYSAPPAGSTDPTEAQQQAMVSQPQSIHAQRVVEVEPPARAVHQPLQADYPATGETIRLPTDNPASAPVHYPPPATPSQGQHAHHHAHHAHHHMCKGGRAQSWRRLGIILVGVGTLVLLNQLNVNMALIIPPLMILGGIILLRRNR